MAGKFQAGAAATATWQPPDSDQPQRIPVTVIAEETPGFYRCQTTMGLAILFAEDALG